MVHKAGVTLGLHLIGPILIACAVNALGSENCETNGLQPCSQYKICMETGSHIYPGKITELLLDLFVPKGQSLTASLNLETPSDMSVIISDAYLAFQDGTLGMTEGSYQPQMTEAPGGLVNFSTQGTYDFGDIDCNGTRQLEDQCNYCLMQITVEYLMANILGVSENSTQTVTATFVSSIVTIDTESTLVMRPLSGNSSKTSNVSTNIPDTLEFPASSAKSFQVQAMLREDLSTYKVVFRSSSTVLRIATVRVLSFGEIHKGVVILPTDVSGPDEELLCEEGPDTRIKDFGYLPTRGADTINLEVVLLMTNLSTPGETYAFEIDLEVDSLVISQTTKNVMATNAIPIQKINVTTIQGPSSLPKGGQSNVSLMWEIPPYSSELYEMTVTTRHYSGPGGLGMICLGTKMISIGSNIKCNDPPKEWKPLVEMKGRITSIPFSDGLSPNTNTIGFEIMVMFRPDIAEAFSSHELAVTVSYHGDGSPQIFKFYFNVTDEELFTEPDENGDLPFDIFFYKKCLSGTASTGVSFALLTEENEAYGRLVLDISAGASVNHPIAICDLGFTFEYNVIAFQNHNIKRRDDGLIEAIHFDILSLNNVMLRSPLVKGNADVNYFLVDMYTKFIVDDVNHINKIPPTLQATLLSNNKTLWTGNVTVPKRAVKHYPGFVVLTEFVKQFDIGVTDLWYHYSLNGSYYFREALAWANGNDRFKLEFPTLISYLYFSTDACAVVCGVTSAWLPLKEFIIVVKDPNNGISRLLPKILDQDVDTCINLPVAGDNPSMLWLKIKDLTLFRVTSMKVEIIISGEGIECTRHGQKIVKVGTSMPSSNDKCNVDSDIAFCTFLSQSSISTETQCYIQCECGNLLECSNIHIIMQSSNKDRWRLCELTINDLV